MFKYGSFRHFLIKVFMGALLISIGIFSIVSLYTYNSADPGFNTFSNNSSAPEINNYFGSIGAYASSYLIIIFGHFAYIFNLTSFIAIFSILGLCFLAFSIKPRNDVSAVFGINEKTVFK